MTKIKDFQEKNLTPDPSDRSSDHLESENLNSGEKSGNPDFKGRSSIPFLGIDSIPAGPPLVHSPLKRTGRLQLLSIEERLTARDRAVLEAVQKYRFLTSDQIGRMFFSDCTSKKSQGRQRNLLTNRLKGLGLIASLERQIGGPGGGSAVGIWYLTEAGHRLLTLNSVDHYKRKRFTKPSDTFLTHTVAVAECAIQIMDICRYSHDLNLEALDTEPTCWRYFNDDRSTTVLKPDMFVVLRSQKYEDRWFIEIDCGSEHSPQIVEKCNAYLRYYYSGVEQRETDMFPYVMWVVKDEARKQYLKTQVQKEIQGQEQIFLFITEAEFEKSLRGLYDPKNLC